MSITLELTQVEAARLKLAMDNDQNRDDVLASVYHKLINAKDDKSSVRPVIQVTSIVNASQSVRIDADEIAQSLRRHTYAVMIHEHMSAFYGKVPLNLQIAFADAFLISYDQLKEAARKFSAFTGESYSILKE
jgi:hypothetical protein